MKRNNEWKNVINQVNSGSVVPKEEMKATHMRSADYDALIAFAVDVKDPQWARELYAKKMELKQAEDFVRSDFGFV